jgi:hypothetical protein
MISQFTETTASEPIAGDICQWIFRWSECLHEANQRRCRADTLSELPDAILRDIGVALRDFEPPRRLILPLDRR